MTIDWNLLFEAVLVILAAASAVVAALARRDSRRSADSSEQAAKAAEQTAWLESENDYRERTPQLKVDWKGEIRRVGGHVQHGATLRSMGPERYRQVFLRLLDPPQDEVQAAGQLIGPDGQHVGEQVELGPVDVGQAVTFGVAPTFTDDGQRTGGNVYLQAIVQSGGDDPADFDEWVVPLQVSVPDSPARAEFA